MLASDSSVSGRGGCPPAESIWASGGGEVDPAADEVLIHALACGACGAAWRAARELRQAGEEAAARPRRLGIPFRWALAATVIVAAILLPFLLRHAPSPPAAFRAVEAPRIVASSAPSLSRDRFVLEWSGAPDGTTYDVRVTTADLDVVTSAFGLDASRLPIPPDALSKLAPGETVLWQVTAYLPDGRRLVSVTFSTSLQ